MATDFRFTEMGNAERMAYLFGDDLKYCDQTGWMSWNGNRWEYDTGKVRIYEKARETVNRIRTDAKGNKKAERFADSSESINKINNMISFLGTFPNIAASPHELDKDHWLFQCANGVIDLKTGEFRESRRDDLITKNAGVLYDPDAKCPKFLAFMNRITEGRQELTDYLKRAVGYSLTGDVSEQDIFILYGKGANGKSTFLEMARAVMGDYAANAGFHTFMKRMQGSGTEDLARLRGARLVTATEPEKGAKLSEPVIKLLTGGEPVTARMLYKNSFEFYPKFKVFFGTNYKPVITGTDHGIWRRLRLIPFNAEIPEDEIDTKFKDKLYDELSGILNWAIEGCLEWQQSGLQTPAVVKEEVINYRCQQDTVFRFIKERLIRNPDSRISKKELYEEYQEFCEDNDKEPLSKHNFGSRLKEYKIRDSKSDKTRYWNGIELITDVR